jgi:hypothetical protein
MESQDRYTISYRSTEICQVMDWIRAGQCGCIVGMRGAGKSNFLRFLLRNDVQQHYRGQNHVDFLFVLVNLLSLTKCTSWGFYELLLSSLLDQLHPPQVNNDTLEEITALRQEATRTRDTLTAQRAIEHSVAILCQSSARRLVLFFDEFDATFRNLDPSLFRILRAVRDSYKDQISYIVIATRDLVELRNDVAEEVEHFYRLVSRNACGLGPYNEADSWQMLAYLAEQRSIKLNKRDSARLIELSGGHAGLLKSIAGLLWSPEYGGNLDKLSEVINDEPMILRECRKVWDSLSENERAALCSLSRDEPVNQQIENWLKFRGILQKTNPPKLFSPVFKTFALTQWAADRDSD